MSPPLDRPIRAVAFDMDGLIFDTEALFFRVARDMLASRGKIFTAEIMAAMIGRQAPAAGLAFKSMAGLDETPEALIDEAKALFLERVDVEVRTTEGVVGLLEHLAAIGVPRCLATSSRREFAERLLRRHNLLGCFDFRLTAEDVARSKPDPEIYLTAAGRFGIEPGEMMVLEDSPAGIAAAVAAGAFAVAVPHEHSPVEALSTARWIVESLADPSILALLSDARGLWMSPASVV